MNIPIRYVDTDKSALNRLYEAVWGNTIDRILVSLLAVAIVMSAVVAVLDWWFFEALVKSF